MEEGNIALRKRRLQRREGKHREKLRHEGRKIKRKKLKGGTR
jgi:hypothetical protein